MTLGATLSEHLVRSDDVGVRLSEHLVRRYGRKWAG